MKRSIVISILLAVLLAGSLGANFWLAFRSVGLEEEAARLQQELAALEAELDARPPEEPDGSDQTDAPASSEPASSEPPASAPSLTSPIDAAVSGELLAAEETGGEPVLTYGADFSADPDTLGRLGSLLQGYGKPAAFFAFRLDGERALSYNADRSFAAASAVKAPFARYCYEQIQTGAAAFDETMVYAKSYYIAGTGVLKDHTPGGSYSLQELLFDSLHYSDNIAYRMLTERFGTEGYNAWLDGQGIESLHIRQGNLWPDLTARELAAAWQGIAAFVGETDGDASAEMLQVLTGARTNLIGQALPGQTVAHKGGWMVGAYHDAGIVYGDAPYLLVVLTESDGDSPDAVFVQNIIPLLDKLMQ